MFKTQTSTLKFVLATIHVGCYIFILYNIFIPDRFKRCMQEQRQSCNLFIVEIIQSCFVGGSSKFIIAIILLLLLKPAAQAHEGKTMLFISCFTTRQAPAPRKTEESTTQENNQLLKAPLNPSSVPVSITVSRPQ